MTTYRHTPWSLFAPGRSEIVNSPTFCHHFSHTLRNAILPAEPIHSGRFLAKKSPRAGFPPDGLTDLDDPEKRAELADHAKEGTRRIWQFKSPQGVNLNLSTNSLSLTSESHKSYRLGSGNNFRDVIEFVTNSFFDLTELPVVNRIGLRYIDWCPVPDGGAAEFLSYYHSSLPLDRFDLEIIDQAQFVGEFDYAPCKMRYVEKLLKREPKKLVMDFDAWRMEVSSDTVLDVSDHLHDLIGNLFERIVKEPVLEYMRKPKESTK